MTFQNLIDKLCIFYKQNKYDDIRGEKRPNLIVAEALKWVCENLADSECQDFYDEIIRKFTPTMTTPFPLPVHFETLYSRPIQNYVPDYKAISLDEAAKTHAEENKIPQSVNKVVDFSAVVNDYRSMTIKDMYYKYGMGVMSGFSRMIGLWAYDNNFELVVPDGWHGRSCVPSGGYTELMLKPYFTDEIKKIFGVER